MDNLMVKLGLTEEIIGELDEFDTDYGWRTECRGDDIYSHERKQGKFLWMYHSKTINGVEERWGFMKLTLPFHRGVE